MKFGCCGSIEEIDIISSSGADFIEFAVTSIIQANISEVKEKLDRANLKAYSFNVFLPGDLPITGPNVDIRRIENYVNEALKKVSTLGGKIIVFGSGRSRSFPEGFSKETASIQIIEFLKIVDRYAKEYDIKIAIEPLNKKESNIINTTLEGLEFAYKINSPNIGVLIDNYHADLENEPLSNIYKIGEKLYHVHVSDRGRVAPGKNDYDFKALFNILKEVNYKGYISIECRWEDKKAELPKVLEYLRKEWK
ncbi:MAG: sugar phosphate isomerase/epimerase [bacterium]|nr:sugar phosphate isomerase/epimerase [bacterium]